MLAGLDEQLRVAGLQLPDEPHVRAAANDVLHPNALMSRFALAQVGELPAGGNRPLTTVRHDDGELVMMRGRTTERVACGLRLDEDPERVEPRLFDLLPASTLLLIAVQEGLAYAGAAELQCTDIDPDALAGLRMRLLALRQQVIVDELDVVAGFERLSRLFDPVGGGSAPSMALPQLCAVAMTAIKKWVARRGRLVAGAAAGPVARGRRRWRRAAQAGRRARAAVRQRRAGLRPNRRRPGDRSWPADRRQRAAARRAVRAVGTNARAGGVGDGGV